MGAEKTERLGLVEELRDTFTIPQSIKILEFELRKLLSEHETKINIYLNNMQGLQEEQVKLEDAIKTLKELNLAIPEEYTQKLSGYPERIRTLENEVERERMLLNYLKNKVIPLTKVR